MEVSEAVSEDEAYVKVVIGIIGREKFIFDNAVVQYTTEIIY